MQRTVGFALLLPLLSCWEQSLAAETVWNMAVEGGSEYDSNFRRLEVIEGSDNKPDGGALMRTAARFQLHFRENARQQFSVDAGGVSKVLTSSSGQSENLLVLQSKLAYQRRFGKTGAQLGAVGRYFDGIDIRPFGNGEGMSMPRSYRTYGTEVYWQLPSPPLYPDQRVQLYVSAREFQYKPDDEYDWRGTEFGMRYSNVIWLNSDSETAASVELRGSYGLSNRSYSSDARRNLCPDDLSGPQCGFAIGQTRSDMHHSLLLESVYTKEHIYSLRYGVTVVDSNSYGYAQFRQRVELGMTTELPGNIFASALAVVRFNTFIDPLLLARDVQSQSFISIEEENRNSLSLHLGRDMGADWGIEARLAIYSNEFATEPLHFRRQTAYLGLLYHIGAE